MVQDEGVGQRVSQTHPLQWVLSQQPRDEVFRLRGDRLGVGDLAEVAVANYVENVSSDEGQAAGQQLEAKDADAPVVGVDAIELALRHLW